MQRPNLRANIHAPRTKLKLCEEQVQNYYCYFFQGDKGTGAAPHRRVRAELQRGVLQGGVPQAGTKRHGCLQPHRVRHESPT